MFLSCKDPALMQGNFLGDFLNNQQVAKLPVTLQKGIVLHRAIDSFTDKHSDVKACTKRLRESQGKYVPVVIDVLFDYILHQNWERYSQDPFQDFETMVYINLMDGLEYYPSKMQKVTIAMVNDRFLSNYITIPGLTRTFNELIKRSSFQSNMSNAVTDLLKNIDFLDEKFNSFFPDIIAYTKKYCG